MRVPAVGAVRRLKPARWGIAGRSAAASAVMVFLALAVAGALLLAVMVHSLLANVDDAAAGKVGEIGAALQTDTPEELDPALLATNDHISVVQVVDAAGVVRARSAGAPAAAMLATGDIGTGLRRGIQDGRTDDIRFSARVVHTATGAYTVIVGGGSEAVETTATSVARLLAIAAPLVSGVAALASFRLVRRSLSSVDAIRRRVAQISASELTERVPVPETRDEVAALAETMNAMLARIEAGHRAQRQFVGDASHELRSPLATIISTLEVVDAHPELLNSELASDTLLPEAHRMRTLVDDLLLLARADETGLPVGAEPVVLHDILAAEADRLRRTTALTVDLVAEPAAVLGAHRALSRAVRNLADNAARHARNRVELTAHIDGNSVMVGVADDGAGIPAADRDRVFDRFVRLDSDRSRKAGGSGLGLAIVAEIVAAHHGTISIVDRPGGGTVVTAVLPSGSASQRPLSAVALPSAAGKRGLT